MNKLQEQTEHSLGSLKVPMLANRCGQMIRICVVDDHAILRRGVADFLEAEGDLRVVGEADSGFHALELVRSVRPEVLLLDINLPDQSGIELMPHLLAKDPSLKIVVFSGLAEEQYALTLLRGGAMAYSIAFLISTLMLGLLLSGIELGQNRDLREIGLVLSILAAVWFIWSLIMSKKLAIDAAVRRRTTELSALVSYLQGSRESDRLALSQELHDELGALLTNLGMSFDGLDERVSLTVFRLIQESLTNVLRHAQACHLTVTIEEQASELKIVMQDDGKGFDPAITHTGAYGISGMTHRAQSLGGNLEVLSKLGEGTMIRVCLPIAERLAVRPQIFHRSLGLRSPRATA